MSDFCIYIQMPSYLRQWFIHRHGGSHPVQLIHGSVESKLLKLALIKPAQNAVPHRQQPDEVAIKIPFSKQRDPRIFNDIPDSGKRALLNIIKNDFDVDCWSFLHDFGRIGQQQKDIIYLFMELRGICEDGTCWDAIAKIYQRQRKAYLSREARRGKKTGSDNTNQEEDEE